MYSQHVLPTIHVFYQRGVLSRKYPLREGPLSMLYVDPVLIQGRSSFWGILYGRILLYVNISHNPKENIKGSLVCGIFVQYIMYSNSIH